MLVINIPADGISLEVSKRAGGDLSEENCGRIVAGFVDRFLAVKPDAIFLNVCYRRALFDSDVFDSVLYDVETDEDGFALRGPDGASVKKPNPPTVTRSIYFNSFFDVYCRTLPRGIDLLEMAANRIKNAGCALFVSVRMNDAHYTDDSSINSRFSFAFGGSRSISGDGALLNYALPAVRNHYRQFALECIKKFDPDGIEFDWLRHWTVLPEKLRGDFSILSGYMAELKRECENAKKGLKIAARVPSEPGKADEKGMDPARWIADGNVDIITVENYYVPTNYEMPVDEWRRRIDAENAAGRPYALLCGSDWGVSCAADRWIPMDPPLVRGFVRESLERGADGVYLFNFFETGENSAEIVLSEDGKPTLTDCFDSRLRAAREPFGLPRRYVHVGESCSRYPIVLGARESYRFDRPLHRPFGRLRISAGTDGSDRIAVSVNGRPAAGPEPVPAPEGFGYLADRVLCDPARRTHKEIIYTLTEAAPAALSFTAGPIGREEASAGITVTNVSGSEIKLLWLETAFE